ncbi:hypothetical protein TNCV_38051 [Trichonephila clavipes]|nr:hypothetical protein TNCV_38051 [Trichonephila clavipes]
MPLVLDGIHPKWLRDHNRNFILLISWPAQSADLNVIERSNGTSDSWIQSEGIGKFNSFDMWSQIPHTTFQILKSSSQEESIQY